MIKLNRVSNQTNSIYIYQWLKNSMISNPARLTAKPIEHGILLSIVSVNIPREVKTNTIVK